MPRRVRPTALKKVRRKRPVGRSSKQKRKYSGKKKRYTNKCQVVVDARNSKIICLAFAYGSCHDFTLYKNSKLRIHPAIKQKTDSGYQGIKRFHRHTDLPEKNTKHKKLNKEQKCNNRKLAKERIKNEHVIGKLKIFKIIAERYRNHSKFGKRFALIAGIYNAHIAA